MTLTTPLQHITVHANQNAVTDANATLDAYLNGRVVQRVLLGNVSLDDAQWFVDQIRVNRSGDRSAFLLDVADEFHTMGFLREVLDLIPNGEVYNTELDSVGARAAAGGHVLLGAVLEHPGGRRGVRPLRRRGPLV